MRRYIVLSIFIAFIITFGSFFVMLSIFDFSTSIKDHEFFKQEFDPNLNKIFLLGSSHVGSLNSTLIIEKVSNFDNNFVVYNLAYDSDDPEKRNETLEKLISLKPKIIFYGISYRDFESNIKQDFFLPDPNHAIDLLFTNNDFENINPRLITLKGIKTIFNYTQIFPSSSKISFPNTPFIQPSKTSTIILNDEELHKEIPEIILQKNNSIIDLNGQKYEKFVHIVERLKQENITLVVFTTPLHPKYVEQISNFEKLAFQEILSNISNDYNVVIYNFTNTYNQYNIWNNLSHVALNDDSDVYSNDVANMIISEINS